MPNKYYQDSAHQATIVTARYIKIAPLKNKKIPQTGIVTTTYEAYQGIAHHVPRSFERALSVDAMNSDRHINIEGKDFTP